MYFKEAGFIVLSCYHVSSIFCLTVNYKDAAFVGLDCVEYKIIYADVFLNGIRLRRGSVLQLNL